MKRSFILAIASWAATLLAACGTVKVESVRVPASDLNGYMSPPGIYYALPRSEVALVFPVTLERQTKGFTGNIIDDCVAACGIQQADGARPKACELAKANDSIVLGRPEIARRELQDLNHLYRLNIDGGFLDGVAHAVTVAENGVLSEATSKVSNQAAELVLGIVSQLGKLAASGSFGGKGAAKGVPDGGPIGLTCKEARDITTKEAGFRSQIAELEKQRTAILVPKAGVTPVLAADQAKLAADRLREHIVEIEQAREKFRAAQDLVEVKKTFKTRLLSQGLAPAENRPLGPVQLFFREVVEPESSEVLSMKIHEVLNKALVLHASIAPLVPAAAAATWKADANEPLVAGYRYRIPMAGVLTVTCRGTAEASSVCATDADRLLIEQEVPIAQYGALASLPVEFKAKGATVGLLLHPSTGGIRKVDLGVEPVGAKPLLDTIESLRSSREARRTREGAEEEAQAQAAADAELNQLTREKDLLKLKKEIRDLQKDLGQAP